MKKGIVSAIVLLMLGVNAYAAGDLVVGGSASIASNATVSGSVGIGIGASTPITKLDIQDYVFTKIGQAGVFIKNNVYITALLSDGEGGYYYAEAKNLNGVIYTRAHAAGGTDSGWVAGTTATCSKPQQFGSPLIFKATTTVAGVTLRNGYDVDVARTIW